MDDNKEFSDLNLPEDESNNNNEENKLQDDLSTSAKAVNETFINVSAIENNVVMLVGPGNSGKTVALIRLMEYLQTNNICKIRPNYGFISDKGHRELVNKFLDESRNINYSPDRTGNINFLLLDFYIDEEVFCQILEAPGEHYFSETNPNDEAFKNYMSTILNSEKKKIFVFFFERDMLQTDQLQRAYAQRLSLIVSRMKPKRDKIIFLYNKVDELVGAINKGEVKKKTVKNLIVKNPNYKILMNTIRDTTDIKRILFVPYSGGEFYQTEDKDKQAWSLSNDIFPKTFWTHISESVKSTKYKLW